MPVVYSRKSNSSNSAHRHVRLRLHLVVHRPAVVRNHLGEVVRSSDSCAEAQCKRYCIPAGVRLKSELEVVFQMVDACNLDSTLLLRVKGMQ